MKKHFSHEFGLPLATSKAIQLFTPRGEEKWVPGWRPVYLEPDNGATMVDMVFTTSDDDTTRIWTCLDWEPDIGLARYFYVLPGIRTCFVNVQCRPDDSGGTLVRVGYTHIALSSAGSAFIESITEASYAAEINEWAELIGRAGLASA